MKKSIKNFQSSTILKFENNKSLKKFKVKSKTSSAIKISIFNICLNIILSCFKFFAGIFGNSYALVADGFHSLSDVFVGLIVMIGIKISAKKPDEKYEYGYGKIESIYAIFLSFILFDVGLFIGFTAVKSLISKSYLSQEIPSKIALISSIISIALKIIMFTTTLTISKKTFSNSLKADAWHQFSDALSEVAIFLGVFGAMLGLKITDTIASFFISLVIIKVSIDIFKDSSKKITDYSAGKNLKIQIQNCLKGAPYVQSIHLLKTKISGNEIAVEIEIIANDDLTIKSACILSNKIKYKIFNLNESIKTCNVLFLPKSSFKS